MLIYVSGGSGSGKSAFAESLIETSGLRERAYIATMEAWGEEGRRRILRHRQMRAGKGFTTYECPRNLAALELPKGGAVLLEDVSNLFANEWFGGCREIAVERVLAGVEHLVSCAELVVLVGNDIFCDGVEYDTETQSYLFALAALNCRLAELSQRAYEVVCGIPILQKGEQT